MSKQKKVEERNSLEQFLLRMQKKFTENKTKTYQFIAVFAVVVLVILAFRLGLFRSPSELNLVDAAYYNATAGSSVGFGAPDAELLSTTSQTTKKPTESVALRLASAEAYLAAGNQDLTAAKAYSRGVKSETSEKPADPSVNYQLAYDLFDDAKSTTDARLQARANYGAGVAQESLASVAPNDEAVVAALELAKEKYSIVVDSHVAPYERLAKDRLSALDRNLTTDFYKSVANTYRTLPDPVDEESILPGQEDLNVGEALNVEGFETAEEPESGDVNAADGNNAPQEESPEGDGTHAQEGEELPAESEPSTTE